ncbi:hypothetical protein J0A68_18690 [Algoriphagus sp. H41]|uniref:Tellurite resistance protein TerB n=1 Tax=Algoriphagus oliviformis TaxID=2811231 RepID=A0ABS3C7A7_9BACT|nr:hypothetical protein [Algoriphagus oliviformis]MBN7812991.1 hypothetical protein [Algoriphagus oliviformis]
MENPNVTEGKNAALQLAGLIYGVSLDGVVNWNEFQALKDWCREYERLAEQENFQNLYSQIRPIIDDGNVNSEELEQIREILEDFLDRQGVEKDPSTNIHFLGGVFHGIVASGDVNTYEIYKLNQWLEKHSQLQSQSPLDELMEILKNVLKDNKVDDAEAKQLKEFFSTHLV